MRSDAEHVQELLARVSRLQLYNDALAKTALERGQTIAKLSRRLHAARARGQRLRTALQAESKLRQKFAKLLFVELRKWRTEGGSMLTQTRVQEIVAELRATATGYVQRYAATHAPHVPAVEVDGICAALGDISVEEACRGLDTAERGYRHEETS